MMYGLNAMSPNAFDTSFFTIQLYQHLRYQFCYIFIPVAYFSKAGLRLVYFCLQVHLLYSIKVISNSVNEYSTSVCGCLQIIHNRNERKRFIIRFIVHVLLKNNGINSWHGLQDGQNHFGWHSVKLRSIAWLQNGIPATRMGWARTRKVII